MSPFKKAKRRFNENRIDEAIELYKQCIKENICIADSYINMAQCYTELNKNQEAIVVLEEGIKKLTKILYSSNKEKIAEFYCKLGYAYRLQEYYNLAHQAFNTASAFAPDNKTYQNNLNDIEKILFNV